MSIERRPNPGSHGNGAWKPLFDPFFGAHPLKRFLQRPLEPRRVFDALSPLAIAPSPHGE